MKFKISDNDCDDDDHFDDFLVCCLPALLTNHDTNLQYPPIMTVPLHPLLLIQIHNTEYKSFTSDDRGQILCLRVLFFLHF